MEWKIYSNKQKLQDALLRDAAAQSRLHCHGVDIEQYKQFNTQNYAIGFSDGDEHLFVLRIASSNTVLIGSATLASMAANVLADYHLSVGACVGENRLVETFFAAYQNRVGGTRRQALFAGGCFWCMAKPYYEYDGISRVFSGYAGGDEINPNYEQVKGGHTHHRETVMLEYDSAVITFKELLDIYFETIDPFDDGGQFIDRGENYTCAIYTDDAEERKVVAEYIRDIERRFNRKVQVRVLADVVFYKAEEYHQDYALKNPSAMEEELKASGRLEHTPRAGGKKS